MLSLHNWAVNAAPCCRKAAFIVTVGAHIGQSKRQLVYLWPPRSHLPRLPRFQFFPSGLDLRWVSEDGVETRATSILMSASFGRGLVLAWVRPLGSQGWPAEQALRTAPSVPCVGLRIFGPLLHHLIDLAFAGERGRTRGALADRREFLVRNDRCDHGEELVISEQCAVAASLPEFIPIICSGIGVPRWPCRHGAIAWAWNAGQRARSPGTLSPWIFCHLNSTAVLVSSD